MCKNLKNMESHGTEFLEMVLEVRKAELKAKLNIYLLKQMRFFRIYLSSNNTITFQRGKERWHCNSALVHGWTSNQVSTHAMRIRDAHCATICDVDGKTKTQQQILCK